MPDHQDLEAFLHIVHVSDMHCKDASAATDLATDKLVQQLVRKLRLVRAHAAAGGINARWEQGLAGHDPAVHEEMCKFLAWFAADPQFGPIPAWLVDTGDLSSLGDIGSIKIALGWLDEYASILGAAQTLTMHGNHDAWPDKFPLFASREGIAAHQQALRATLPASWPQSLLKIEIPHGQSHLELHALNSALEDRWFNTLALGEVGIDPHWLPAQFGVDQLPELARRVAAGFGAAAGPRDLRVVALHHPVHYPPPEPFGQMVLRNDRDVADALIGFDRHHRGRLAHLILSGHTHIPFPAAGELPGNASAQRFLPLADGQLQLVAGSLAQMPRASERAASPAYVPQQFQILTFYASAHPHKQHQVVMARRLVGRPAGTGAFEILKRPDGFGSVETVVIAF